MRRGVRRRLARILPSTQGVRPARRPPLRVPRFGTGRRSILPAATLAAVGATVLSGPTAGALAAIYATVGAVALRRARLAGAARLRRSAALDAL
ncbi:MAG: hypothetical protein HOV79_02580, partial [Hamadaea sp.]|nr:hypothetical protein [Hamadaea sp.]